MAITWDETQGGPGPGTREYEEALQSLRKQIRSSNFSREAQLPLELEAALNGLKRAMEEPSNEREVHAKLCQIAEYAGNGDTAAVKLLMQVFDEHPDLWRGEHLAAPTDALVLAAIGKESGLVEETTRRQLAALRAEHLPADATQLEIIAFQRVTQAFLFARLIELQATAHLDDAKPHPWIRLQDLAEKRFGVALKNLSQAQRVAGRKPPRPQAAASSASQPSGKRVKKDPGNNDVVAAPSDDRPSQPR